MRRAPRPLIKGQLQFRQHACALRSRGVPRGSVMPDTPTAADATIESVGEFGLIDRLARIVSHSDRDPLQPAETGTIGIGDDAALWTPTPGTRQVLTTDALVEGVHFRLSTTSWRDLGWKALAENVSDI